MIAPVHAKTHAEFLNTVFGTDYKQWMKTVWPYHSNTDFTVWMVRFYGEKGGWKNRVLENGNVIREEYFANDLHALPLLARNVMGRRRIVVSIEDRFLSRTYTVLGVYDLVEAESTNLNRIYRRLPDKIAKRIAPEIYN